MGPAYLKRCIDTGSCVRFFGKDKKSAVKRFNLLIDIYINMEAEPGIEPRYTALQAAAILYFSKSYT